MISRLTNPHEQSYDVCGDVNHAQIVKVTPTVGLVLWAVAGLHVRIKAAVAPSVRVMNVLVSSSGVHEPICAPRLEVSSVRSRGVGRNSHDVQRGQPPVGIDTVRVVASNGQALYTRQFWSIT